MTPSEKEKIIKDSYEAIKDLYILRNELLTDAGNLEAAKESNRKLSDRVANLEVTIKALNSAIDKKDVEIKRLNNRLKSALTTIEMLEAEKKSYCCDKSVCSVKEELELLRKAHAKLCCKYNTLCENNAKLEDNFHELRRRFSNLYSYQVHDVLETKDMIAFSDWIKNTFGDFGIYDEEE